MLQHLIFILTLVTQFLQQDPLPFLQSISSFRFIASLLANRTTLIIIAPAGLSLDAGFFASYKLREMSPRIIELGILSFASVALAAPFPPTGTGRPYGAGNYTECDFNAGTSSDDPAFTYWHHHRHAHGTGATNQGPATTTYYTTITNIITITPQSASPSSTFLVGSGSAGPITNFSTVVDLVTTSNAASPTKMASPATSPSANSDSSTSSSKKGIAYNDVAYFQAFNGYDMRWAYNWGSSPSGSIPSDIEYVPMLWGNSPSLASAWQANAQAAINSGSTHLLAFNEPDLSSQSNIDPTTAAQSYSQYMSGFPSNVKLGAPAVSNAGAPSGLTWLQSFLDACTHCQIDFIPIHWYSDWNNVEDFQNHATTAYQMTGKPIWVTEFGTNDGDNQQIEGFVQNVTSWMDQQPWLERYAYFMAAAGSNYLCESYTTLSGIGLAYVQSN